MSNLGKASAEGTKNYSKKFIEHTFNQLGKTKLFVSEAGFGTYRVDVEIDHHHDALNLALEQGVNIIDTSSNYANGFSEELIGDVLNIQTAEHKISRDNIVIVSKGGYIQGDLYIESQQLKKENKPYPDLVEYSQGLEHCIHPSFLETQITNSLKRLHLDCIDIYLLHNPEYYLSACKLNKIPIKEAREEYYRRIKEAFEFLEKEVEAGRIQHYGVSSNTFISPSEDLEFTSLTKLIEIAESISKDHHFSVIQCPMNLFEMGALLEENQTPPKNIMTLAHEKNIGVLINRPLNAITPSQKLIRLADFWPEDELSTLEIQDIVNQLISYENSWENLDLEKSIDPQLAKDIQVFFNLGTELQKIWSTFEGFEYWKEALSQYVFPRIEYGIAMLSHENKFTKEQEHWFEEYLSIINHLIKEVSNYYKSMSQARSHRIKTNLLNTLNNQDKEQSLSQLALCLYFSIKGISSVLVGMRQTSYVTDVIATLKRKKTPSIQLESWKSLSEKLIEAL